MRKVKYFFRNVNLLNILLITAVFIMANYTVLPLFNINIKNILPARNKATKVDISEKPAEIHISTPSMSDYMLIAENNLFHPERKIPVEKKEEQPLPKPDIVLYGTLITDDISLAYLEDLKAPYSTPGRGKRQTALRKGDTMAGFTLIEVEADKIVMARGNDKMVVHLNESRRPKKREASSPGAQVTPGQPMHEPAKPASTTKTLPPQTPEEQSIIEFFESKRK